MKYAHDVGGVGGLLSLLPAMFDVGREEEIEGAGAQDEDGQPYPHWHPHNRREMSLEGVLRGGRGIRGEGGGREQSWGTRGKVKGEEFTSFYQ